AVPTCMKGIQRMNRRDVPKAALIDVDGVLHIDGDPIPGAVEALAHLRELDVPFRLLTNTTVRTRAALGNLLRGLGFDVADEEIITAPVAAAAYVRRRFPDQPCYAIVKDAVLGDFGGITLTDGPEARVVIVGGAEENFTYQAMNHAFRLLMDGAALIAIHRNLWWMTAVGPTLDAGAFVKGLEHVTGRRATVVGKPAAPFFRAGFRSLGLPPSQVVMVGDTHRHDILPAIRLGATGALVQTGSFRESDLVAGAPDYLLASVAELPNLFTAQ
ncbi:MAG TPA: TIGR01458 family HAD-type hydrolase, partial [Thermomicrobiales bacterium]|nr:TIGR01458 family HAD-type hydrolase [Thermomicrobiales bacterium]